MSNFSEGSDTPVFLLAVAKACVNFDAVNFDIAQFLWNLISTAIVCTKAIKQFTPLS
jgi:hypothetical protein